MCTKTEQNARHGVCGEVRLISSLIFAGTSGADSASISDPQQAAGRLPSEPSGHILSLQGQRDISGAGGRLHPAGRRSDQRSERTGWRATSSARPADATPAG